MFSKLVRAPVWLIQAASHEAGQPDSVQQQSDSAEAVGNKTQEPDQGGSAR